MGTSMFQTNKDVSMSRFWTKIGIENVKISFTQFARVKY